MTLFTLSEDVAAAKAADELDSVHDMQADASEAWASGLIGSKAVVVDLDAGSQKYAVSYETLADTDATVKLHRLALASAPLMVSVSVPDGGGGEDVFLYYAISSTSPCL